MSTPTDYRDDAKQAVDQRTARPAPAQRWTDPILLKIFERFPPTDVIFKDPGPRPAVEYADEVANPFGVWFGSPAMFAGRDILDLGCGYGGRPVRFAELGARSVSGVEIGERQVSSTRAFAESRGVSVEARVGFGERIPFPDHSFDLITMHDVMEHVISPERVLAECHRVLRPGGQLAAMFPPYYHLWGGSHLPGYATIFPGLHLVFSTKALRSAAEKYMDRAGWPWREFLREEPTDKLWNMNGLTVRGFRRLVSRSALEPRLLCYYGHAGSRLKRMPVPKRWLAAPAFATVQLVAQIPVVQEVFCIRIVALLEKPRT